MFRVQHGVFECPSWMQILVRDTEDALTYVADGKTGGINVIDLANINSCSFIATQDLGKKNPVLVWHGIESPIVAMGQGGSNILSGGR